jgi:hypothetical protein
MAIVTRLGKGSKLTIEEMDNNLLSLESGVSDNVSSITSKLDKGSYTGTAKDLENAITAAVTASGVSSGISIVPTSPAPSGTGTASFFAVQNGTYTNYGGLVVAANSFAIISRSAAGAFSISQTTLSLAAYALLTDLAKYVIWSGQVFSTLNNVVSHLNKDWYNVSATLTTDVPGISIKWIEKLSGYSLKTDLFQNVYNILELFNTTFQDQFYNTSGVLATLANTTAINKIDCLPGDVFTIEGLSSTFAAGAVTQGRTLNSTGGYVGNLVSGTNYSAIFMGIKLIVPTTSTIRSIALYFSTASIVGTLKIKKNDKIVTANDFNLRDSLFSTLKNPAIIADLYKNFAEDVYVNYFYGSTGPVTFNSLYSAIDLIDVTANDFISFEGLILPTSTSNWFRFLNASNGIVETVSTDSLQLIAGGYRLKVPATAGITKLGFWYVTANQTTPLRVYKTPTLLEVNKVKSSTIKNRNEEGLALKFYQRGNLVKPTQLMPGYLLGGQSNQEGRIELSELPAFWAANGNKITDVQNISTDDGVWHEYNTTNYAVKSGVTLFSYELMLLKLLIDYKKTNGTSTDKIYTVKRAEGGTSIAALGEGSGRWTPEFEKIPSGIPSLLKQLETRYRTAKASSNGAFFTPNGLIWHQGEGDRNFSADYYLNMKFVIWYVRGFTNTPELPIMIGGINSLSTQYNFDVEQSKLRLVAEDSFVFYAPVTNIQSNLKSDGVHFNYAGGNELATTMFNIMVANSKIFGLTV